MLVGRYIQRADNNYVLAVVLFAASLFLCGHQHPPAWARPTGTAIIVLG